MFVFVFTMYESEKQNIFLEITTDYSQSLGFFWGGGVMVFNVTFNNISAMSWQSVFLVEETGVS
jgi:hypothetical protein